jgi:S1-C subfamily serine protease
VEELPAFYKRIASREPGSALEVKVLRGEETFTASVTTAALGELQGEDYECPDWGLTVKAITRQMQLSRKLPDTLGVLVTGVKQVGPADLGGLVRNDVIRLINKEPVGDLAQLMSMHTKLAGTGDDKILLTVRRNGATRLVVLNIEASAREGSATGETMEEN